WNSEVSGPVYVVADRAPRSSGPLEGGDLVVRGVFDQNLDVVGGPGKTTNLRAFIAWLEENGQDYDPPWEFLVGWVRSSNEETRPDEGNPMQDQWLEYQSLGSDPDEDGQSTVATDVEPAEVDESSPVLTTPSPPPKTPGG
ncbi:MAG: hypothetical protein ABI239_05565, partial [Aquihabitans sp.]